MSLRAIRVSMLRDHARALRAAGELVKSAAWDALADMVERGFQ